MLIEQLDLIAYGHFTETSLSLGPGFHLVWGFNEAGKSTALRAVRQMLYGFDGSNTDAFIHAYAKQRIGATLRNVTRPDEPVLKVIRRKGNKGTLRDEADVNVIDDSVVAELLGGVDEAMFRQRYGIDYDQLVAGGQEMTRGQGDLGQLLFSSGAGLTDLTSVQAMLAKDAETLFKARGREPAINRTLGEIKAVRKEVEDRLVSTKQWQETETSLNGVRARKVECTAELKSVEIELGRLTRWKKSIPLVAEYDDLCAKLETLKDVPRLPPDFGERRTKAVMNLRHSESDLITADEALKRIRDELSGLTVSESLLNQASRVQSAISDWGAHAKAQKDRPGLQGQLDALQAALAQKWRALGRDPLTSEINSHQVGKAERTRVTKLGGERSLLLNELTRADADLAKLQRERELTQGKLSAIPSPSGSDELRRAVKLAREVGPIDRQLGKEQAELKRRQKEAEGCLLRLNVGKVTQEEVEHLALPSRETVARYETEWNQLDDQTRQLSDRANDLSEELRRAEQQLELLRRQQDVPTESELQAARDNRELGWSLIRRVFDDPGASTGSTNPKSKSTSKLTGTLIPDDLESRAYVTQTNGARTLLDAYEQAVAKADQIADRLRREADRVAQRVQCEADCDNKRQLQKEIQAEQRSLEDKRQDLESRWKSEWQHCSIPVNPPREMAAWLFARENFLEIAASVRMQAATTSELESARATRMESLARAMNQVAGGTLSVESKAETKHVRNESNPGSTSATSLAELLTEAEEILENEDSAKSERERLVLRLNELMDDEPAKRDAVNVVRDKFAEWTANWEAAMTKLGLTPQTMPEEAVAYLESLFEIDDLDQKASGIRQRLAGIDEEFQQFERRVKDLAAEAFGSIEQDATPELLIAKLKSELTAAERNHDRRRSLLSQLEDHDKARLQAERLRNDSRSELHELSVLAKVADSDNPDGLVLVEQQVRERDAVEAKCDVALSGLRLQSPDGNAVRLIDEVHACDADSLDNRLHELTNRHAELSAEQEKLSEQGGQLSTILERMSGGNAAISAEMEEQQLIAKVEEDVTHYARLRLAAAILRQAIERYRKQNEGPVLRVASDLFAKLTLGSFEGLRIEPGEKDIPRLLGVRPGGRETVEVTGMSEGTCDQLYLALRLASLDLDHGPRRHLPLIIDDILIQFDDIRCAAALKVLYDVSAQRQVIFFTHHSHLIDIARNSLPTVGFKVQELLPRARNQN